MKTRLLSILSAIQPTQDVIHYKGLPPILTGGIDTRQQMDSALYLVIEVTSEGVFLNRFDAQGECVGDTWHMNIDDAKDQALGEFKDLIQDWEDIPSDVEDVAVYGLARAKSGK